MGATTSDEGDEKNAHKILLIRTKDSGGHVFIGANIQGGYWHVKKYVSFSDSDKPNTENITIALSLWDTPPLDYAAHIHDHLTAQYYPLAHGLICVYNVESIESFNTICHKISYVYKNPQKTPFRDLSKVVIILIGHKTKEFTESIRKVPQEHALKFANALDITFLEIASSNWKDMSDLYTIMGKNIYQIYGELPLKNKQAMTAIIPHTNHTMDDEKRNGTYSNDVSESESLSELSDAAIHEHNQPTKQHTCNRSKPKNNASNDELIRHRSSNENPLSTERRHKDSIECNPVSMRFKEFIEERVQMPYLFELFAEKRYDDVRMIEFFEDDMLQNEIGITNTIHRKLFLKECEAWTFEIEQFRQWLLERLQLRRYLKNFESNGLITMALISKEIHSQSDFEIKLQITLQKHQQILWQQLQIYKSATNDAEYDPNEYDKGVITPKKPKEIIVTNMTNAYANIQRNKQLFNQIVRTNQYQHETSKKIFAIKTAKHAKSTRDLESMLTKINLDTRNPQRSWEMNRSSSITSTQSLGGTPVLRSDGVRKGKRIKKRRKSFSLGMQ